MTCSKCGSDNIDSNVFQENLGGKSVTKTKSKYKEKKHGFLWWASIGWWWWIIDLLTWIFAFLPRLVLRLFSSPYKKKKGKGKERSVTKTNNKIKYKTIYLCKDCGHRW